MKIILMYKNANTQLVYSKALKQQFRSIFKMFFRRISEQNCLQHLYSTTLKKLTVIVDMWPLYLFSV